MVSVRYPEVVNIAWVMYGLPFFTFTSFIFACFKSSSIQFFHFNPGQYIFNSLAFGGSVCKYVIYSKFYSMTYLSSIITIQRRFFYFFYYDVVRFAFRAIWLIRYIILLTKMARNLHILTNLVSNNNRLTQIR